VPWGVERAGYARHGRTLEDGSVVDEAIDAPEPFYNCPGHVLRILRLRHIRNHRQGLLPSFTKSLDHCFSGVPIDVGYHHAGSFSGQAFAIGSADPMGTAGDDNHPILESIHRSLYSDGPSDFAGPLLVTSH
jgi:hypothetical protein